MSISDISTGAQATAAIIQFQKKAETKFICSACGADRGCNCNAPAIEKLAHKQEQARQASKAYRERKAEKNQQSRHMTSSGSPGFNAAREWAKRIGREVEQLTSGGFRLTSPDGAPVCFHSLKRLNERLKEIEEEAGTSAETAPETAPTETAIGTDDLTVEQLAVALKRIGGKLSAALDLVPNVLAEVLRQHKRPPVNKVMTDALRAGLSTRRPGAAHEVAIQKITMELQRLNLDPNDISIVIRKPSDALQEPEEEPVLHNGASRLIPVGNGADPEQSADAMRAKHAAAAAGAA